MNIGEGKAEGVHVSRESLWGCHGGQLEFVSMRIVMERHESGGNWLPFAILRFTDHDVRVCEDAPVDKKYYEIIVPFSLEETK